MTERVLRAEAMSENDRYMRTVEHLHPGRRWRFHELVAWASYVNHADIGGPIGGGGLS